MSKTTKDQLDNPIPDGAFILIEEVIKKYQTKDEQELLERVCQEMEERYTGDSLEYHAAQMKMRTTVEILDTIGIYLVLKELEPNTTFKRRSSKPKQNKQGPVKKKNKK